MWLNEIIQPPPQPEANRWIEVTAWQVAACDGNACAAAILAYFFARHYGKVKQAAEGRQDNDIAAQHGLQRRRGYETLWFRATDEQIEKAIFFYKRRVFPEAIRFLEEKGFVSKLAQNPNPRFPGDKSRYFKLNPEAIQKRLREIFDYGTAATLPTRKNADPPGKDDLNPLESTSRKNADPTRKNADPTRKNARVTTNLNTNSQEEASDDASSLSGEAKNASPDLSAQAQKLELQEILAGKKAVESDEELLSYLPAALTLSRAKQGAFAFAFWRLHFEQGKAVFDPIRARYVDARLKGGYTLDRIILAIRGVKFSPHHMGENDKHEKYTEFKLILRDGAQVEKFEAKAVESDEADRRRAAEAALTPERAPVPESRYSAADIEMMSANVAELLRQGYAVPHIKAKFSVGKTLPVNDWTRVLERAEEIHGGARGVDEVAADESPEWKAAEAAQAGAARSMPAALEEDLKA